MKRFQRFVTMFLCFTMIASWGTDVSLLAAFAETGPASVAVETDAIEEQTDADSGQVDETAEKQADSDVDSNEENSTRENSTKENSKADTKEEANNSKSAKEESEKAKKSEKDDAADKSVQKSEKDDAADKSAQKSEKDDAADKSAQKTAKMDADRSATTSGAKAKASKTDGSAESPRTEAVLVQQEIKAELVQEPLYEKVDKNGNSIPKAEQKEHKTKPYKAVNKFWNSLMERKAQAGEDAQKLKVRVSGMLPKGVTAEARYITLEEGAEYTERGLCAIDLTLRDKDGAEYLPEEPVTVAISGKAIQRQLEEEHAPILYAYQVNKERAEQYRQSFGEKFYAADVTVFKSDDVRKKLLRYQKYDEDKVYRDGEDAVRYKNDKDGLATNATEGEVKFEYNFRKDAGQKEVAEAAKEAARDSGASKSEAKAAAAGAVARTAHLVLSAQMDKRTLEASTENASVTIQGALDQDVKLQVKEISAGEAGYARCLAQTAAVLKKNTSDLSEARAFDIQLIDPATGKTFQPDDSVKVTIDLKDDSLDPKAGLDVVFVPASEHKAIRIDARTDADVAKFATDQLGSFVAVGYPEEKAEEAKIKTEPKAAEKNTEAAKEKTDQTEKEANKQEDKREPAEKSDGEKRNGENAEDAAKEKAEEGETSGDLGKGTEPIVEKPENLLEQKSKELAESKPVDRTLTAKAGKATVTVKGNIPEGVTLEVSEITQKNKDYDSYVEQTAETLKKESSELSFARPFDIKLIDAATGSEIQPGDDVKVTIDLNDTAVKNTNEMAVVHFDETNSEKAADVSLLDRLLGRNQSEEAKALGDPEVMDTETKGDAVTFSTDGFSVYVVAGYTVDFHWGETTYSVEGGSTIFLSELFSALINNKAEDAVVADDTGKLKAVADDMSQIKSVSFSNPQLVHVDEVIIVGNQQADDNDSEVTNDETMPKEGETDWRLVSLAPFTSNEILTITLKNGDKIEIPVTDELIGDVYGDDEGETVTRSGGSNANPRVTADGVTYVLQNNGTADGYADVYAYADNSTIHNKISYIGKTYTIRYANRGVGAANYTRYRVAMDPKLVVRAAGKEISLPDIRTDVSDEEKNEWGSGFVAGKNNDDSDYKIWKKAEYDPDTNSVEYTMKYFQAMKQNVPLDFIFIYDDSISMYDARWAPTNTPPDQRQVRLVEAQGTRVVILAAAQKLLQETQGYDIRVAVGGASDGDDNISDWYEPGEYNDLQNYLATYHTGVTDHSIGINNALKLANQSVGAVGKYDTSKHRIPIVVYLSDFADGGGTATFRNNVKPKADKIHSMGSVYGLKTIGRTSNFRTDTICSGNDYLFFMNEISEGVEQLENIITDAIGYYMKDKITIKDDLSDALEDRTPTDDKTSYKVKENGTYVTKENAGTVTNSKGSNSWSIGGTSPYLGAGTVYTETFTVELDDDTVYSGAIPTNGAATVQKGGSNVNEIKPDADKPDQLFLGKSVTFLLGELNDNDQMDKDSNGVPASTVNGIKFTLENENGDTVIAPGENGEGSDDSGNFTTADGSFTVPYKDKDGNALFQHNSTYTLKENKASVDAYNGSTSGNKLKAPDKNWIITVDAKGEISIEPESAAGQTPKVTKTKAIKKNLEANPQITKGIPARFVLWNHIEVEAKLIPITVEKKWPDKTHPHDAVPFTVYGVNPDNGERTKLKAYDGPDPELAKQVKYIEKPENNGDVTSSDEGKTWTRTVYVPDKVGEGSDMVKYYSYKGELDESVLDSTSTHSYQIGEGENAITLTADNWDDYANTQDGKIRYGQSYSYDISEGDLVYDYGWYTPGYGNNATDKSDKKNTVDSVSIDEYTKATEAETTRKWHDYENVFSGTTSTNYYISIDVDGFEYKEDDKDAFYSFFGFTDTSSNYKYKIGYGVGGHNCNTESQSFFEKLKSFEIIILDQNTNKYYKLTSAVSDTIDSSGNRFGNGNVVYSGVKLPSAWSSYPVDGRGGSSYIQYLLSTKNTAQKLKIKQIKAHFEDGADGASEFDITLYSASDSSTIGQTILSGTSNYMQWGPEHDPSYWCTAVLRSDSKKDTSRHCYSSVTSNELEVYDFKPAVPAQKTDESFSVNEQPTLSIENTWNENPLTPVDVKKDWKIDEDADGTAEDYATDTHNAKRDINYSIKGTTSKGTEVLPIFDSRTPNYSDSAWLAKWEDDDPTWTMVKNDTDSTSDTYKDKYTWDTTVFVPQYDTSTYDRANDTDNDPNTKPCEAYTFDANSITEETNLNDIDSINKDVDGEPQGEWMTSDPPGFIMKTDTETVISIEETSDYPKYRIPLQVNHRKDESVYPPEYWFDQTSLQSITSISISFNYTDENGSTRQAIYTLDWSANPKNFQQTNYMLQNLRFPSAWTPGAITEVKLNGNVVPFTTENLGNYPTQSDMWKNNLLGQVKFINNDKTITGFTDVQVNISEQNLLVHDDTVTTNHPEFTLTNTYTPYKKVDLESVFQDDSNDKDSTKKIGKVVYTITGAEAGNADYSRTVVTEYDDDNKPVIGEENGNVSLTASKSVYIPKGEYKIEQTAYTIESGSERYNTTAFKTDAAIKVGDSAEKTKNDSTVLDGAGDGADITADTKVTFTNTRKTMPVKVQTVFDPVVTDSDAANKDTRPLADRTLNYKLSYYSEANGDIVETSGNLKDDNFVTQQSDQNYKNYRKVHENEMIPSYGIRGEMTECNISSDDFKTALPDYNTYVYGEDKDNSLVFTIAASINRAPVIVSKSWDEDVTDDEKADKLTFQIRHVDKDGNTKAIYGKGDEEPVGLEVTKDADGNMIGTFTLGKDDDDMPIYLPALRKVEIEAGDRYVLTEVKAEKGGTEEQYFVNFTDQSGLDSEKTKFKQTNPAGKNVDTTNDTPSFGKANEAWFVLDKSGMAIDVNNAKSPYICKIEEKFTSTVDGEETTSTVEKPFRTLNKALTYARTYGDGQPMSADHAVKIQMLIDYIIPSSDKVTLGESNDNIIITTAETSGGLYNFAPTFTEEQGRSDEDSKSIAIIRRADSFTDYSLIRLNEKDSSFATEDITFDGGLTFSKNSDGTYTVDGTPTDSNGGFIKNTKGTVTVKGGTTMRNVSVGSSNFGGAIYAEGNALESAYVKIENESGKNIEFLNCYSKMGGAVYSFSKDITVDNSGSLIFKNCVANNGGAMFALSSSSAVNITNNDGSTEFKDCKANNDGGAIYATGSLTITANGSTKVTFNDCIATVDGGAVCSGGTAELTNVTINGKKDRTSTTANAEKGGAIYSSGDLTIKQTSTGTSEIKNCSASGDNGGAINVASGKSVSFEGNVVVYDNGTMDSTGKITQQKNVVLDQDNNTTIKTTDTGLGKNAHIGVYVIESPDGTIFTKHGMNDTPFGTYDNTSGGSGDKNLKCFQNDVLTWLYGYKDTDTGHSDGCIYWSAYICKITDANNNLLYYQNGENYVPAVYTRLGIAFPDFDSKTFFVKNGDSYSSEGVTPAKVKMLVIRYDIYADASLSTPSKGCTLTTAAKKDTDGFPGPYEETEETRCVINRGKANKTASMFTVDSGASFATENIIFDGGAVFDTEGNVTGTVGTNNKKVNGGIVNVAANGGLTVSKGTTMQNTAVNENGGAIYAAGTVTVSGDSTIGKESVIFRNCKADQTGAIYTEQTDKMNVSNATFSYCWSDKLSAGICVSSAEIEVSNCNFENCHSIKKSNDNNNYGGGAIRSMGSKMTLLSVEFEECSTVMQGGAVFHKPTGNGSFTATNCSFTNCEAGVTNSDGGAAGAAETQANTVSVESCTFTDCTSSKNAGAFNVYKNGSTINITDSTFIRCKTTSSKSGDYGNGGAVRTTGSKTTIENCTFDSCEAMNRGGAIHCKTNTTIKGTTQIKNCKSTLVGGGGVYLEGGTLTIENVTMQNCIAPDGGGIYQAGGTCEFKAGSVSDCIATKSQNNTNGGGGIYLGKGTLRLKGGTISECKAVGNGGGIYTGKDTGEFTFSSGSISQCIAKTGGGIYTAVDKSKTVKISATGNAISNCVAKSISFSEDTVTVPDTYDASNFGGGIYQANGTLDITSSVITGCSANRGGGIYLGGGTLNLKSGAALKGNTAAAPASGDGGYGGGVFLDGSGSKLNLNGSIGGTGTGEGNHAVSGGGIYQNNGEIKIESGSNVTGNNASGGDGGGIRLGGGKMTVESGVNVKANSATASASAGGNGGGIYLGGENSTFTLKGVIGGDGNGDGNTAVNGGGIYQAGGELTMEAGSSVKRNSATTNGGGIYLGGTGSKLTISGSESSYASVENNAASNGGGIYQASGTLGIAQAYVRSNTATVNGGGIYLGGGSFTLNSGEVGGLDDNDHSIGGNTAVKGGGLYVGNGTETKPTEAHIKGGKLAGNSVTAVAGGGGIAIGGPNVRLLFEGNIQVWGNTMPMHNNQTQCDVCLSEDSNEIIRTTSVGLNEDSHIGVYVTDDVVQSGEHAGKQLHKDLHGTTGLPFGTFDSATNGKGDAFLNRFINNRTGTAYHGYEYYYGVRKPDSEDAQSEYGPHRIYWADYVCEITDANDNLLFTNAKATAPALYQYLDQYGAFEALREHTKFYTYNETTKKSEEYKGNKYYVRMLVFDYALHWSNSVEVPADGKITLTMAPEGDENLPANMKGDVYKEHNGCTTIRRGNGTGSMFTTDAGSDFTLTNVTIDGGATRTVNPDTQAVTWNGSNLSISGGLFDAKGTLTLGANAVLQNSRINGNGVGGAINFTGNGTLNMSAVETTTGSTGLTTTGPIIQNCKATNGAALSVKRGDVTINFNGGSIKQCESTNGGVLYVTGKTIHGEDTDGTANVSGRITTDSNGGDNVCIVSDCQSTNGGAAYVTGSSSVLNLNGTIDEFSTTNGGAIYVNSGGTVNLNKEIRNCSATNGGAIYVNSGGTVNLNKEIRNCSATNGGGGVYVNGSTLNMTSGTPSIKNCTAALGGAILETGSSARVNISVGEISENTATGNGGGALRMEGSSQAAISGSAEIKNNKAEGAGDKWGGAVNMNSGTLTISGGTISGNTVKSTNNKFACGGAVSVGQDCTLNLTGGTIIGNTAISTSDGSTNTGDSRGPGIYLAYTPEEKKSDGTVKTPAKTATLNISGAPVFHVEGQDDNTVTLSDYSSKKNGTESVYTDNKVRQDIYLSETGEAPVALKVTGDLVDGNGKYIGDGKIWVWAANENHYFQRMPFAVPGDGVEFVTVEEGESLPDGKLDAAHLKAFRNAQDDDKTGNPFVDSDTLWLYGTFEDDGHYIYWNGIDGSRKVILRKVDASYSSMKGREFTVYKGASTSPYIVKNGSTKTQLGGTNSDTTVTVEAMKSLDSGVFWVGNLPYGWYIIKETDPETFFYLVVTAKGVFEGPEAAGGTNRSDAETAAAALYTEKK